MTMIEETLAQLEATVTEKGEEYALTHRFHAGDKKITEAQIAAREKELDVPFPPSFRDALKKHGAFTLGKLGAKRDHLVFKIWPLDEHRTALEEYAEQLECDVNPEAVADEIGLEAENVAVLGKIVLIGIEGNEDYVGFDLRTRNERTNECEFCGVLFEDCEIDALAEEDTKPCKASERGFDTWLAEFIDRRSK